MIPFIKKALMGKWPGLGLGPVPEDLLFDKFADRMIRDPQVGIISFLVKKVSRGKQEPVLVLRFPRYFDSQGANQSLELEYRNLSLIRDKLKDEDIRKTIPRPVLWEEINQHRVLAINFLFGEKLSKRMMSKDLLTTYVDNFDLAFGWLLKFQKCLGAGEKTSLKKLSEKVIKSCTKTYPGNPAALEGYFSDLRKSAEKLGQKDLPLFPQHVDFHAENVFIVNNRVSGVIDWEDFEGEGIPAFDLYHFIKTYFEAFFDYFAMGMDMASIDKLSSDKGVLEIIRGTEESYYRTLGIDPELSRVLLPLYLIQSVNIAVSPRKKALGALKRLITLLQLGPFSLEDLLLFMSSLAYRELIDNAFARGDRRLASLCDKKIKAILEKSKFQRPQPD